MSTFLRYTLNVFLYIIYVAFFSILFTVAFPIILQAFGETVWEMSDPRFDQIQIFIALLVLLVTLIFRKYFYIQKSPSSSQTQKQTSKSDSYTSQKKSKNSPKVVEKDFTGPRSQTKVIAEDAGDEIQVYVEKKPKK